MENAILLFKKIVVLFTLFMAYLESLPMEDI